MIEGGRADYVTRLEAEATFWRLWLVVIGPMIWLTLVAWVISLWPATWPTPLRIAAGLLSVLVASTDSCGASCPRRASPIAEPITIVKFGHVSENVSPGVHAPFSTLDGALLDPDRLGRGVAGLAADRELAHEWADALAAEREERAA